MDVFRSLDEIASWHEGTRQNRRSVAAIGSFDGIHLAHQELLSRVRSHARLLGAVSVAVTFNPHPVQILAPAHAPKLLTPASIKLELLEKTGVDQVLILPFTKEFSYWPPGKFVEEVLVNALRAVMVVVGENFRFGHNQAGDPAVMAELGKRFDFETETLRFMKLRSLTISSSQIRRLLQQGRVALAGRLLGRPFNIRGPIAEGLGIGRRQTVPTLNLAPYTEMLPASGVYVTWAKLGAKVGSSESGLAASATEAIPSVTNIGHRPTFGTRELGVETHLLQPPEAASSTVMELAFLHRLRDERKFASPEELKAQIVKDIARAEGYFRRVRFRRVRSENP